MSEFEPIYGVPSTPKGERVRDMSREDDRRCWEIIRGALARGWGVEMKRHTDKSGNKADSQGPENLAFPEVYTVRWNRFGPSEELQYAHGRHGRLLAALEQADAESRNAEEP